MEQGVEKELLFCDTFAHEGEEEQLHVDLIRFSPSVIIHEVRIVPQEKMVHNELEIIGMTSPSSFALDVYMNDSTNPLEPTFDPLGTLDYQAEAIAMSVVKPKISSDMVVVCGKYTILTLCIYGYMAPPPSLEAPFRSPSPTRSRSGSSYSDSRSGSDYSDDEGGRSPGNKDEGAGGGGGGRGKKGGGDQFELFEPFSPVNSPDHLFDLSDDEMGSSKQPTTTPGGYVVEELSDEEIAFDNEEFDIQEGAESYLYSEEGWMMSTGRFNPFQCDFAKLESYPSPSETPHEALMDKLQKTETSSKRGSADEASKLRDIVLKPKEISQPLKWVETLEEIPSLLYPGLAQLQKKSSSDGKEVMQKLVGWTLQCLSLDIARQMPIALNIRHLKAGIRMVPSIAALGRKCAHALIKHGVIEKLCELLVVRHMASPLKLLSLKAVDSLLDFPQGIERFLGWTELQDEDELGASCYQLVLNLILNQPGVRVVKSASALLAKTHIYELLSRLQENVEKVVSLTPVKSAAGLPEDFWNIEGGEGGGGGMEGGEGAEDEEFGLGAMGERLKSEGHELMDTMEAGAEAVSMEWKVKGQDEEEEGAGGGEGVESDDKAPPIQLPPGLISAIVECLEELKKCLEKAAHTIVQPHPKSFPTSVKCFPEAEVDYYPTLVRMFDSRRLLKCLHVLVTAPCTAVEDSVFAAVRDLLLHLLATQQGCLYLSSTPTVINSLTRALTQAEDNQLLVTAMHPLTDFLSADSAESCSAHNLGLLLIHHLQVLQSLDILRKAPKQTMSDLQSPECLSSLHTLYSMTLTPIGRCAVSYMLSLSDNVTSLLPFVEPRNQREHDNKLAKSSVSSRYAAVLLLQLLQSQVHGGFLILYGNRLLHVAEFFKENSSPTMSDLYNWLHPLKEVSSNDSSKSISSLVGVVKDHTPLLSIHRPGKANSPIITSLRILLTYVRPLAYGNKTDCDDPHIQRDPKWTQAVISLFSSNAMEVLIDLLKKLSEVVLPSWCQRQPLTVTHAGSIVNLATFALQLLKAMLTSLLSDGDYQLRDARVVSALLGVHTVLCSAPYSSVISSAAPEIQSLVIDILVMYSKSEFTPQEEEKSEAVAPSATAGSLSCWCLMLQELFKHTLSVPHNFLSGLMIFTELLPLPLPVQVPQALSSKDCERIQSLHQLWALHLEPFLPELSDILQTFINSSSMSLQQMLRRVCAQLADLSPALARLVAKRLLRTLLHAMERELERPDSDGEGGGRGGGSQEGKEGGADGEEMGEEVKRSPNSSLLRTLTSCAVLCQQPAVKIAILDLIQQKDAQTGQKSKVFSRIVPLLVFLVQKKESALQAKICIMSILNSLCNVYIAMNTSEMDVANFSGQQLSDCLPAQSLLEQITTAVLSHVTSPDQPMATVLLGLKTILSLCQYNAGLLHVYLLLPSNIHRFPSLLERIIESVKSTQPLSNDILSSVSLLLELLRVLLSCEVIGRVDMHTPTSAGPGGRDPKLPPVHHFESRTLSVPKSFVKALVTRKDGTDLLAVLVQMLVDRRARSVAAKESGGGGGEGEEEGGASQPQTTAAGTSTAEEEERILGEFMTETAEIIEELNGFTADGQGLPVLEPDLRPPMHSIEEQFEIRSIETAMENGASSPEYWLASPPHDEGDLEPDKVTKDLSRLASTSCGGLNLEEELKKYLLPSPPRTPPKAESRKRKIALSGPEAQKRLKEAMEQRIASGRRDLFRTRKQNTSRPPSMHVDDFMAKSRGGKVVSRGSHMPGGHVPFMPQPGIPFMPPMGGRGWMGGPMPPPGLGYHRGGMGGMRPWDSRLPHSFLSTSMKHPAMRTNPMWPAGLHPAYSRSRESGGSRGGMMWPGGKPSSSSSRPPSDSRSSSSRHSVYKRLT